MRVENKHILWFLATLYATFSWVYMFKNYDLPEEELFLPYVFLSVLGVAATLTGFLTVIFIFLIKVFKGEIDLSFTITIPGKKKRETKKKLDEIHKQMYDADEFELDRLIRKKEKLER